MSGGLLKAARSTKGVTSEMKDATRAVIRFKDKAVSAVKDVVKSTAKLAGATATGVTAAFLAAGGATEEYRTAMGKLNTAYDAAGLGADAAATAYREFYKILGDTDTADEASQLLSKLTQNEKDIARWTRCLRRCGGHIRRRSAGRGPHRGGQRDRQSGQGDRDPADALNWVGISEDKFNERLEAAGSESERNRLILDTLTESYEGAAAAFEANNREIIQARQNQAAVAEVTGRLGTASTTAKNGLMKLFGVQEDGSLRAGVGAGMAQRQGRVADEHPGDLGPGRHHRRPCPEVGPWACKGRGAGFAGLSVAQGPRG